VSKSIVGLVYGIALADGKVPPPEAPLLASLPEYADLAADPARKRWTIHHVMTMTMGTDWDELGVPYSDPTNSEIAMDTAPDRYRFVLGAPVVMEPGKRWIYNGGATGASCGTGCSRIKRWIDDLCCRLRPSFPAFTSYWPRQRLIDSSV
jgi:CubicO group peptidase (beta-lactamase class C family)